MLSTEGNSNDKPGVMFIVLCDVDSSCSYSSLNTDITARSHLARFKETAYNELKNDLLAEFNKTKEMYDFIVDLMAEGDLQFSDDIDPQPVSPLSTK